MKKNLYLLLVLSMSIITGCSSDDDDDIQNDDFYLKVEVLGETYNSEIIGNIGINYLSCAYPNDNDIMYESIFLANIETSKILVNVSLFHFENAVHFQGFNKNNSNVVSITKFDIYNPQPEPCIDNFDFEVELYSEDHGGFLEYDTSASNYNKIESIKVSDENNQQTTYTVKGNFNIKFIGDNSEVIPLKGEYRTFISVLK